MITDEKAHEILEGLATSGTSMWVQTSGPNGGMQIGVPEFKALHEWVRARERDLARLAVMMARGATQL